MCKKVIQFLGIKMSNISWLKWAYSKILRIHELPLSPHQGFALDQFGVLRQLWVLGLLLNYMTHQTYVPGRTMLAAGPLQMLTTSIFQWFVKQYKNSPLVRYCLNKRRENCLWLLCFYFGVSILCREILCLLTSVIC